MGRSRESRQSVLSKPGGNTRTTHLTPGSGDRIFHARRLKVFRSSTFSRIPHGHLRGSLPPRDRSKARAHFDRDRLIPGFYRSWFAGASKARSLRAAQLRFLRELRAGTVRVPSPAGVIVLPEDPLFWAGFVLIGEPE